MFDWVGSDDVEGVSEESGDEICVAGSEKLKSVAAIAGVIGLGRL